MKVTRRLARTDPDASMVMAATETSRGERFRVPNVATAVTMLAIVCLATITFALRSDTLLSQVLGMTEVPLSVAPATQSIVVSRSTRGFNPPVVVVRRGAQITFVNQLNTSIITTTASDSPTSISRRLAGYTHATILLHKAGLYHYYDAATGRPVHTVANNAVIKSRSGKSSQARQGWIVVLSHLPGLRESVVVPTKQDLFEPKAMVASVGTSIVISNHDGDAHNFVVDPASPAGAAFIVNGTTGEPPRGGQRTFMVQRPGLYHFYCTLHTRQAGTANGWRVLVPRRHASGYRDHNPMEAWVVVLPADTTLPAAG